MGFGDERAPLRAEAAEPESTALRLNQLPDGGYAPGLGGTPKLVVTAAEKNAAAGTIGNELPTSTKKAGNHADEANTDAVSALSGWVTAAALKKVEKRCRDSVQKITLGESWQGESANAASLNFAATRYEYQAAQTRPARTIPRR